MKCPECKGKLELIEEYSDLNYRVGSLLVQEKPYYKCDSCRCEFDPEDIEEE